MAQTYDLFVGSLPGTIEEDCVAKLFDKFGKIQHVKVIDGKNGKKAAFVHYVEEADALTAIDSMNMYMYNGIGLQVRKSQRWFKRESGGDDSSESAKDKLLYQGRNTFNKVPPYKIQGRQTDNSYGVWHPSATDQQSRNSSSCGGALSPTLSTDSSQSRVLNETIIVTHVESPVTFYAYFVSKVAQLQEVTHDLQTTCPNLRPITSCPSDLKVYGALYSADEQWYRCKVLATELHLEMSSIEYIDFGNTEKVNFKTLVELPQKLQLIQPIAMKCTMKNLQPVPNNKTIFDEAITYLKSILLEQMILATLKPVGNGSFLEVIDLVLGNEKLMDTFFSRGFVIRSFSSSLSNRSGSSCNGKAQLSQSNPNTFTNPKKGKISSYEPYMNLTNVSSCTAVEKVHLEGQIQKLEYEGSQKSGKIKALQDELYSVIKKQEQPNPFAELPSILSNIEEARLIRQQLPVRPKSLDYVEIAMQLLEKGDSDKTPFGKELRQKIKKEVEDYKNAQQTIAKCLDKEELSLRIKERNALRVNLHNELTSFCDSLHINSVAERIQVFEATLSELKRVYKEFLNMRTFSQGDMPYKDLYKYYISTKEEKSSEYLELQYKTDQAHRALIEDLQPSLLSLDTCKVKAVSVESLTLALTELKSCLAKEIQVCAITDTPVASVVSVLTQLLCEKLESELQELQELGSLEKEYLSLLRNLALGLNGIHPDMQSLMENKREGRKLRSKLRHALADKKDLEETEDATETETIETAELNEKLEKLRFSLHESFVEEDRLIAEVAHLQEAAYPELNNLYPELELEQYNKYKGLVKVGLELDQFDLTRLPSLVPSETDHASKFLGKAVRLKEIVGVSEDEKVAFMERIQTYTAFHNDHLLPVEAVFFIKNFYLAYVQQPLLTPLQHYLEEHVLTAEDIYRLLKEVLIALDALHSRGLVHGRIHPATVFVNLEHHAVLESIPFFPTKDTYLLPEINGVRFHCPNILKTCNDDVQAFACLALWMMNPNTLFEKTPDGFPDFSNLKMEANTARLFGMVRDIFDKPISECPQVGNLLCNFYLYEDDGNQPPMLVLPENSPEDNYNDILSSYMPTKLYSSEVEDSVDDNNSTVYQSSEASEAIPSTSQEPVCDLLEDISNRHVLEVSEESDFHEDNSADFDSMRQSLCALGMTETTQEA